ncbi:hypothetical protein GCM10007067_05710 [Lysobacter bugurensis]|uniref:Metallo-beta-lactamase domain-containing protein n=2 Tax=Cognatilysobacter bugurensis TaxID=543356 RepID=A0A918W795_9GAMM|nr:hypothetical protein GCM10007067_05710 [Lysobacter bugurensis]
MSALTAEIRKVSGLRFNVLFLSHLDSDHVAGIDRLLLAASGVDEVVLPYLGAEDWALHLAASAASGTLTSSLLDLAADPAGWLGARGVGRIIFVAGVDDDDAVGRPDSIEPGRHLPELPSQDPDGTEDAAEPMETDWSRPPRVLDAGDPASRRAATALLAHGAVAAVRVAGQRLNWVLSPFAFRPSAAKMATFRNALEHHFGCCWTAKDYANFARSTEGRARLRKCYDAVWRDHNLHSMALYAGPATPAGGPRLCTAWHGKFVRPVPPGWISTGDFDASVTRRRAGLLNYYSPYARMVGQLGLPHHGSDLSFNPGMLGAFPRLRCAIAAVGPNRYGHPGSAVQTAVAAAPLVDFVRVDEYPSNTYRVRGIVPAWT